jgi:hypothetical protein
MNLKKIDQRIAALLENRGLAGIDAGAMAAALITELQTHQPILPLPVAQAMLNAAIFLQKQVIDNVVGEVTSQALMEKLQKRPGQRFDH